MFSKITKILTGKKEDSKKPCDFPLLSDNQLNEVLCEAWNKLDASLIEPYLAEDFYYKSSHVVEPITTKSDYMAYLKGKFDTLKKSPESKVIADIIDDNGVPRTHLKQKIGGGDAIIEIKTQNGIIISMLMRPQDDRFSIDKYNTDFPVLNKIAYDNLYKCLTEMNLMYGKDWAWLQVQPHQICFQHMCFRFKKSVFCILIGIAKNIDGQGKLYVNPQEYNNLMRECENNHMTPCLFLIDCVTGFPVYPAPYLIDARTMEPIDLEAQVDTNGGLMSEWEINNCGVYAVVDYLSKNGASNISYCDVLGISPQIWYDKDGQKYYVYVRSIPAGLSNEKLVINRRELTRCAPYQGYFVDVQWNNLLGNNGNFQDTKLFRSNSLVHSKIMFIEIEKAIKELDFIECSDSEVYTVVNNL